MPKVKLLPTHLPKNPTWFHLPISKTQPTKTSPPKRTCGCCSTSLDGYAPIDSIEESAPIGHGVNQYFGSENALLDESTTNITVEEGVSLEGFNGVDSVVVEAPLGHGVTQWYVEGDDPNLTLMMEL